eukprot:m.397746 g.397746  ORF g.397746 m.397746 type:complete len:65 (+) comp16773_c2_seq26:255-449(+)
MMSHAAMPACGDYYCSDGCGSCDDCETPYLLEDSDCSDDEADQSLEPIDVDVYYVATTSQALMW